MAQSRAIWGSMKGKYPHIKLKTGEQLKAEIAEKKSIEENQNKYKNFFKDAFERNQRFLKNKKDLSGKFDFSKLQNVHNEYNQKKNSFFENKHKLQNLHSHKVKHKYLIQNMGKEMHDLRKTKKNILPYIKADKFNFHDVHESPKNFESSNVEREKLKKKPSFGFHDIYPSSENDFSGENEITTKDKYYYIYPNNFPKISVPEEASKQYYSLYGNTGGRKKKSSKKKKYFQKRKMSRQRRGNLT
jgi:hypothetical protein